MTGTFWADTSQYQGAPIDDRYPHQVWSFRTNSGDTTDALALDNARRALDMLDRGRLQLVIAYYFFWPGGANCDLHRELLTQAGLWGHPRLVTMIDVEGALLGGRKRITGDQSVEVNDEATRLASWYGDTRRVVGYLNGVADPELWQTRPQGMRFVVPSYSGTPGRWAATPPPWLESVAFAQQFTNAGRCAPWTGDVDLNYSRLELPDLLALLGIGDNAMSDPLTEAAGQLHPHPGRLRQIRHPEHVNPSTRNPNEAWPYDMSADVWNETVWDGFTLPAQVDDEPKSLMGWVLDTAARVRRIEAMLDEVRSGRAD
ncbi:hypothetical protein NDR87_31375 [Nocardia sp. CDC159]|uniref:Uncharacterized protein n=1 Tax=Nocardia pulmonis TaxID=2951408 RepID=A0A9X2ECI2_9NOCA|nr:MULTISPECIES: hypothetical protein [Nocardia]MCM6777949.1 hypothetical protein [Nocardia pulmonis]MCM6790880.1 hypothetical protein [Nocardia sp. CDC159]